MAVIFVCPDCGADTSREPHKSGCVLFGTSTSHCEPTPPTYAQFGEEAGKVMWRQHQTVTRLERELEQERAKVEALKADAERQRFCAECEHAEVIILRAQVEALSKCCTQRGARMQIMREWMNSSRGIGPPTEWWYFVEERPEAAGWFDADGVPVGEGE